MRTLTHRLKHIICSTLAQFLGMAAIIAVGISLYIGFNTTFVSLQHSQQTFYMDNHFADHYFYVIRAPEAVLKQIESVPGVYRVTGRIQKDIPVFKADGERAAVRLTSYPLPIENSVNQVQLMEGRFFEPYPGGGAFEVMVDPGFLSANGIALGSNLDIVAESHKYPVRVVGTASGPEFTYAMKDASSLITDFKTFGIMMIPHNQAQKIFNLPGQMNQVLVQFIPGANQEQARADIKKILAPYANLADFPRKDQSSHAVLDAKLEGIGNAAGFLPVLFLGTAAAVQFIMIRRMVRAQRSQIGILKALGYNNLQVIAHFSSYAATIGLMGAGIGVLLGISLASYFSHLFAVYFNLPAALGGINLQVIVNSVLLAVGTSLLAGFSAARSIAGINPAESMRSEAPIQAAHSLLEALTWLWSGFSTSWKMAFRSIRRNRLRLIVTVLGVAAAVSLLGVSVIANDSIRYIMTHHFTEEIAYDYMLRFDKPVKEYEMLNISHVEGVQTLESFITIPVHFLYQGRSCDDVLQGQSPDSILRLPVAAGGRTITIPPEGVIISQRTAADLGVRVGDVVNVETEMAMGDPHIAHLKVIGINYQLFGNESYVSLEQANRILQESSVVSGAMLQVDQKEMYQIKEKLSDMNGIASIQSRQDEINNVDSVMGTMVSTIGTMIFFAALLGFVIIFNSVSLSFNERRRELTSLMTAGFTRREIVQLMYKETIPQAVGGILIGLLAGRMLAEIYFGSVDLDMMTIPVIVQPSSYLWAALGGMTFVLVGQWFASRGVNKLDIVELIKNSD